MPLTLDQLQLIRRHLNARVRPPEIARRTGLAVATILRVAYDRKLRRRKLELLTEQDLPEDDAPPEYVAARLGRCPGCGGMVYQWPCLACQMRGGDWVGECEAAENEGESGREGEGEIREAAVASQAPTLPLPHSPPHFTEEVSHVPT